MVIISETFSLDGPRDRVAALLLDIGEVRSCVPGVGDVTRLSEDRYETTLSVRVGPIKSAFRGSIIIDDSGSPELLKAAGRGKDGTSGSMATISFEAHLHESAPSRTTVQARADVTIRGRLGSFGTGVIQATAKQMIEDFVFCINDRLSSEAGAQGEAPSKPVPVFRTVLAGLWARLRSVFRSAKTCS